jgi:hypothetical protein
MNRITEENERNNYGEVMMTRLPPLSLLLRWGLDSKFVHRMDSSRQPSHLWRRFTSPWLSPLASRHYLPVVLISALGLPNSERLLRIELLEPGVGAVVRTVEGNHERLLQSDFILQNGNVAC